MTKCNGCGVTLLRVPTIGFIHPKTETECEENDGVYINQDERHKFNTDYGQPEVYPEQEIETAITLLSDLEVKIKLKNKKMANLKKEITMLISHNNQLLNERGILTKWKTKLMSKK